MKKLHGKQIKFCRWGGLSPVKQKGYDPSMPSFHSPPMRKGIYAFIWPYIETFLLGSNDVYKNNHKWTGKITYTKEYFCGEEYELEHEALHKPRIFVYNGVIWHHLGSHLRSKEIKNRKGSWVKTSYNTFCKALSKELHELKSHKFNDHYKWGAKYSYATNNPVYGWAKDHLEVFIERI